MTAELAFGAGASPFGAAWGVLSAALGSVGFAPAEAGVEPAAGAGLFMATKGSCGLAGELPFPSPLAATAGGRCGILGTTTSASPVPPVELEGPALKPLNVEFDEGEELKPLNAEFDEEGELNPLNGELPALLLLAFKGLLPAPVILPAPVTLPAGFTLESISIPLGAACSKRQSSFPVNGSL